MANLTCAPTAEVLKLVLERISDTSATVQVSALQAAANLARYFSDQLLQMGILDLVQPILLSYTQYDHLKYSLLTSALNFLDVLAQENSGFCLALSRSQVVDLCLGILGSEKKEVFVVACELLTTCAEDNSEFSAKILASSAQLYETIKHLPSLERMVGVYLLVTASLSCLEFNNLSMLVEQFTYFLSIDPYEDFLSNVLPKVENQELFKSHYHVWEQDIKSQQVALECFTNLLSCDSEETPVGTQFLSEQLIERITKIGGGLSLEVAKKLTNLPEAFSNVLVCQTQAHNFIQNLVINTDVQFNFSFLWDQLFWTLENTLSLHDEVPELFEDLANLESEVSKCLMLLVKKGYVEEAGTYLERALSILENLEDKKYMLGTLGVMSSHMQMQQASKVIQVLMAACSDSNTELVVEALNCFFDVFCDERFDQALKDFNVIQTMKTGFQTFQEQVSAVQDAEVRDNAEEALANLEEFIKYKEAHITY